MFAWFINFKIAYLALILYFANLTLQKCLKSDYKELKFKLIRQSKRSSLKFITLENTQTLEECIKLARDFKSLALNYARLARRNEQKNVHVFNVETAQTNFTILKKHREHFLSEPQEYFNCHVLECPENSTLCTLVNDSRFDYFSLYEPMVSTNYSCLSGIGIVQFENEALSYLNASINCRNSRIFTGSLSHIATEGRTYGISAELRGFRKQLKNSKFNHTLAYVGLNFNRSNIAELDFHTSSNESLNCFRYRAWAPGYPKRASTTNTSCVAITMENTWITVDCERKLPYFCDVHITSKNLQTDFEIGVTDADRCFKYLN